MNKTIAIIPAKKDSLRVPNKNIKKFLGIPLFLYSVQYAINEGFTPVVSTDSDIILNICKNKNINYVEEKVDDRNITNCIWQVIDKISCDNFAILTPTSPLRVPGLLRLMVKSIVDGETWSAYTTTPFKPIGHYKGKFNICYRDQDTPDKFMFFDGNIVVCNTQAFINNNLLFNDDSKYFLSEFPSGMQIDIKTEFKCLEAIAKEKLFKHLVPKFK